MRPHDVEYLFDDLDEGPCKWDIIKRKNIAEQEAEWKAMSPAERQAHRDHLSDLEGDAVSAGF